MLDKVMTHFDDVYRQLHFLMSMVTVFSVFVAERHGVTIDNGDLATYCFPDRSLVTTLATTQE